MCLNILNNQFRWDNPQKTLLLATVVLACPENLVDSVSELIFLIGPTLDRVAYRVAIHGPNLMGL